MKAYEECLEKAGVSEAEVAYLGDDLPDIPLAQRSGSGGLRGGWRSGTEAGLPLHDAKEWWAGCSARGRRVDPEGAGTLGRGGTARASLANLYSTYR